MMWAKRQDEAQEMPNWVWCWVGEQHRCRWQGIYEPSPPIQYRQEEERSGRPALQAVSWGGQSWGWPGSLPQWAVPRTGSAVKAQEQSLGPSNPDAQGGTGRLHSTAPLGPVYPRVLRPEPSQGPRNTTTKHWVQTELGTPAWKFLIHHKLSAS